MWGVVEGWCMWYNYTLEVCCTGMVYVGVWYRDGVYGISIVGCGRGMVYVV